MCSSEQNLDQGIFVNTFTSVQVFVRRCYFKPSGAP